MQHPQRAWILILARYVWAFPATYLGLLAAVVALLTGGRWRLVGGVLEVSGGILTRLLSDLVPIPGGASAMTLGHVVIARTPGDLDRTREHERIHVRQTEIWGPLFVPAYLLASVWQWLRGGDMYRNNPFERDARSHCHD